MRLFSFGKLLGAGLTVVIALATAAQADPDAQTVLSGAKRDLFKLYVDAVYQGINWSLKTQMDTTNSRLYCPPEKAVLQYNQIIQTVQRYLASHSDSKSFPFGKVLVLSLQDSFPCVHPPTP